MEPDKGNVMSLTPRVELPAKASQQELEPAATTAAPARPETTVFFKPCFGITVQSSTLCVSVSAKTDTQHPCPPACG